MFNWNDYQKTIEEILDLRLDELRAEIVERVTFAFDEIPHYFFQEDFKEIVEKAYNDGKNEDEKSELEVGDEVEVVRSGEEGYTIGWRGIVSGFDCDPLVMGSEGSTYEMPRNCLKKTGTHYNLLDILQRLKSRNTVETDEVCPHCGAEVGYIVEEGTMRVKCGNCGESILLCSLCEDHSDCGNCPF